MKNTVRIPLIEGGENIEKALELQGARFDVCQVNWPESFPYAPRCAGRIARTKDALVVSWRVSGLGLTVRNTADDGSIWEDSCCEVFVKDPSAADYYNIEVNAAGFRAEKATGARYLPSDFKKRDGYLRSLRLSAEYGLYRQDYCGCVYSMRKDS